MSKVTIAMIKSEIKEVIKLKRKDHFIILVASFNELAEEVELSISDYFKALSEIYPEIAKACQTFFLLHDDNEIEYAHSDAALCSVFEGALVQLNQCFLSDKLGDKSIDLLDLESCKKYENNDLFNKWALLHYRNIELEKILAKEYRILNKIKDKTVLMPTIKIVEKFCNFELSLM